MSDWSQWVAHIRQQQTPAVLVKVDSIVGSAPREVGARMIVTQNQVYGTIGGGNLEFKACQVARDQLSQGGSDGLQRFPLGAGLGQCCGGLVNLMFESLTADSDWRALAGSEPFLDLYLFGAGHVGQAVVAVMQTLPVRIVWVDEREDIFPQNLPTMTEAIVSNTPEAEIVAAPSDSYFLVMTHDHGLDQRLCEQILKRNDFAYFGLIGSHSKRRNFETRLHRRGIQADAIGRMVCPIGIDGISGKQPVQIAISVAAEILQVYDQPKINHRLPNLSDPGLSDAVSQAG